MIFSDTDIRLAQQSDSPLITGMQSDDQIQPSSVDLRLSSDFIINGGRVRLDTELTIWPGGFILGSTIERVAIPPTLVGVLDGKSSLARLGLAVHITAGYIDPGFEGNITLEIKNVSGCPITLRPRQAVCQIRFHVLLSPCTRPYGKVRGSHYIGDSANGTVRSYLESSDRGSDGE